MFDFSWSEIALIVVVALVFIGPKDMPTAIRAVSRGIKAVRRMASEFQGHVDEMVREADLGEARDHLRDLKRFDFRDRIARTLDSDQTISKSLDFTPPPSLSAPAPNGQMQGHAPSPSLPVSGPGVTDTQGVTSDPRPAERPGPAILPPSTSRRLRHEETLWHAPSVIPPLRIIHNGRRVALDPPVVAPPGPGGDTAPVMASTSIDTARFLPSQTEFPTAP